MKWKFLHQKKMIFSRGVLLHISVFVCGAVLMMFELVGSRMFAPYFGTSTYVWTSLIGVILGFLSLGYWYGGKIADQKTDYEMYASIIFLSAICLVTVFCVQDTVLSFFQKYISILEWSAVCAAVVLFAPVSFLLGIVSPYAVRLTLNRLEHSAATVGNLYAVSTAGSIFGTFFAGFYLIPHFGTKENLLLFATILFILTLFLSRSKKFRWCTILLLLLVLSLFFTQEFTQRVLFNRYSVLDVDSEYSRIQMYKELDEETRKDVLSLATDPFGTQCSMFLESDDLVFNINKFYRLDAVFNPDLKKTLMFGGCAYSYPKDFLLKHTEATMDVVEIDPKMTELAKTYFRLKQNDRLKIYHEDARRFLNTNTETYDVIYVDAFNSFSSAPFQLTTKEFVKQEYDHLVDDGVVIMNLISAIDGEKGKFLRAEYATYRSVFPQVYLFPVTFPEDGSRIQNILLVAIKSDVMPSFESKDTELAEYLSHRWLGKIENDVPIFTDNFAPVEAYKRESF